MIDTHCHIDYPQYQEDFDTFIARQKAGGVSKIIVPGVSAESIQTVNAVCEKYPDYLLAGIGLHPTEVKEDWQEQMQQIANELPKNYIALGETGLDYHEDITFKEEQKTVFKQHLEWALQYDLPVIVHSRDAVEDTLSCIREVDTNHTLQGVFHCFSGSYEVAKQITDMGWYLGIGGVITFKNCKLAEGLAKGIPLEFIVLETDAPYMAPVPNRGKLNESIWMCYVVEKLAEVYACSPEQIIAQTDINAKKLFRLGN